MPNAERKTFLRRAGLWITRNDWLILTAILLLAAASRMLHIGDQSMWLDEGIAYWNQKQPDMIAWMAVKDVHPPLYFWLLKGWIGLTGTSAVAMRMFSALTSMLTVAAVVPLAKLIARDASRIERWTIPIIAALLLAINDPEISLAQDVRMYSLRTLLALASVFFYLRWTRKPGMARAVLWVAALVAIYHTHYIGTFMGAIIGLHALFFLRGRQRVSAILWLAASVALFLPWFVVYGFDQRNVDTGVAAALPSNWTTIREIGFKYFSQMWTIMLGLLLLGLLHLTPDNRIRWRPLSSTFLLSAWIGFTALATFIINFWYDFLSPRRILLITPAIVLLTARGLANFKQPARAFLVGAILIYGLATVDDYYPKPPWDDVAINLDRYAEPGELVLMEIYRDDFTFDYYVDQVLSPESPRASLRMWREDRADAYPDGLIALIDTHPTVWLAHWSPDDSAFRFLAQTGHVQTAKMSVDHIGNALDLYRFDRLPPESEAVGAFVNGMTLRMEQTEIDAGRVDLWWSSSEPLTVDYTTSVFLLNEAGQLIAQHDSFPFEGARPTTTWQPGEVIYDPHPLDLNALPPGRYSVNVQVYTWFDSAKQPTLDGDQWLTIGNLIK